MAEEDFIRKAAKLNYRETHYGSAANFVEQTMTASLRFRKPQNKAIFFDEILNCIRQEQEKHLQSCPKAPGCDIYKSYDELVYFLQEEIDALPSAVHLPPAAVLPASTFSLTHLHPTIQEAAGSLYATGHYRQALLDAYIAVDRAVQQKSQLAGSGTRLMETAFSPGNPVLKIGDSADEQQGFLSLFRGAMLAIRNPKAHSLGGTHDAQRALEWLSFASVLLRNLDEAILLQPPTTPPNP